MLPLEVCIHAVIYRVELLTLNTYCVMLSVPIILSIHQQYRPALQLEKIISPSSCWRRMKEECGLVALQFHVYWRRFA